MSAERQAQQLAAACEELVRTEATYVENLTCIVETFQRPLRTWAQEEAGGGNPTKTGGVTVEEIDAIFGSAAVLLDVNSGLLEKLKSSAGDPKRLAATMATWAAGPLRMSVS